MGSFHFALLAQYLQAAFGVSSDLQWLIQAQGVDQDVKWPQVNKVLLHKWCGNLVLCWLLRPLGVETGILAALEHVSEYCQKS